MVFLFLLAKIIRISNFKNPLIWDVMWTIWLPPGFTFWGPCTTWPVRTVTLLSFLPTLCLLSVPFLKPWQWLTTHVPRVPRRHWRTFLGHELLCFSCRKTRTAPQSSAFTPLGPRALWVCVSAATLELIKGRQKEKNVCFLLKSP